MQRTKKSNAPDGYPDLNELSRDAFHEAGHAAAIYYNNRYKNLPTIFFQIHFNQSQHNSQNDQVNELDDSARIEGGRLIQSVPHSVDDFSERHLSKKNQEERDEIVKELHAAMEADIFNLMVGPISEAKYVSILDNEHLNEHLLNLDALKNYGGSKDLEVIDQYLECMANSGIDPSRKIKKIFHAAFKFVDTPARWHSITALSNFLQESEEAVVNYKDIIQVLDEPPVPASYYVCAGLPKKSFLRQKGI